MSTKKQLEENFKLSLKASEFIVSNPELINDFPSGVSYVYFSHSATSLNELNEKLVESLSEKGETVIRIEETGDKEQPWIATPAV